MAGRIYKDWIEAYLEYTQHSEAPRSFHYWTAVSTIAGALRKRVWINMGYFRWSPNFFIFFVAPPGVVAKSTTADIGMDLLQELPYIHIGPAATSWQALIKALSESRKDELLPSGEFIPMSAMTIVASELGTFLDPRNREMVDVLVSLWDGKNSVWKKLTKQDGEEAIVNPWINIIGCTTPSWVAENISDYFSGGGFASRTIFVYAESKRKLVAYPHKHVPEDFEERAKKLVHDLEIISTLIGEYELTEEAIEWGTQWYKDHNESLHPHLSGERFQGYLARKQTHIHKLAMVLAASKRDELVITASDLRAAHEQVTLLEHDMPKIYGTSNRETQAAVAIDLLSIIEKERSIGKTQLYRKVMRIIGYETFEKAVAGLIASGRVKQMQVGNNLLLKMEGEDGLSDD